MHLQNEISPEIIVFAGPNGSGKSTITKMAKVIEPYINADDIKRTNYCSDLEAAQMAENMRKQAISDNRSFTFETVMSTDRNLNLLKEAREKGYFIRCICLALIPKLVEISDIMHIYDNSTIPYRIFKKRKTEFFYWENDNWSESSIRKLVGI
jgi:predicted ABC-type ATPase